MHAYMYLSLHGLVPSRAAGRVEQCSVVGCSHALSPPGGRTSPSGVAISLLLLINALTNPLDIYAQQYN